jgi:pyruvate ferredoxin oxidoreductase gamma subunit
MIEVRFHGRGGQGAVTAAELVAQAAVASGKYAQGFPNFGPERRGAPVTAFLRVSDDPIFLRERIDCPDVVVVLDPTLLGMVNVTEGLARTGTIVINVPDENSPGLKQLSRTHRIAVVDAGSIAMQTLGVPITNTAIIGALVQASGVVSLASLMSPVETRFGRLAQKNIAAMTSAFEATRVFPAEKKETAEKMPPEPAWETVIRGEALYPFSDVEIGGDVYPSGSCKEFHTGNWRTSGRPVMDRNRCAACGICWILCPDTAFRPSAEGGYEWDGRYCKGCGICVESCPKGALSMEEEPR